MFFHDFKIKFILTAGTKKEGELENVLKQNFIKIKLLSNFFVPAVKINFYLKS